MKDFKIYIAVISVFLTIYLVAEFNRPEPVNWTITLKYSDKIPFGTYILYNRLKDIFPNVTVNRTNRSAYDFFNDSTVTPGTYLMIAKTVDLNKEDFQQMVNYISEGNSVFISASNFEGYINDSLKLNTSYEFKKKTTRLNFTSPHLKHAKGYEFKKYISTAYFSDFDTTRAVVLGQNQFGNSNYLSFSFGKGTLYLLANPQVLTNYSLLNDGGADYAAKALSYLPARQPIYWDQYQNHDIGLDESPMRFLFGQPALKWAYYISLAGLFIFALYEIKRRQRIIPIIEPLKNTTVEFVSVVGKVYYEQRDNTNIAGKKILYFTEHLRTNYGLRANVFDKDFAPVLANKTGIDGQLATDLVNHINYLGGQTRITDHELIVLNQLIEKFYTQTGSHGK